MRNAPFPWRRRDSPSLLRIARKCKKNRHGTTKFSRGSANGSEWRRDDTCGPARPEGIGSISQRNLRGTATAGVQRAARGSERDVESDCAGERSLAEISRLPSAGHHLETALQKDRPPRAAPNAG